jgi:hypothetical protein
MRYGAAALPALVVLAWWQAAEWAYPHLGCQAGSKGIANCIVGTTDLTPLVGIGLFWGKLLIWVAVPLSLWLLVRVHERAKNQHAEA